MSAHSLNAPVPRAALTRKEAMKRDAVATPYIDPDDPERERILWEWNYCPDCGRKHAHHHDANGRQGIRCG